ncbi:MAG: DUF4276 family protein [Tannerella sp.]|jgi:hypothetical protein|nr:DUF4276 family protein [Tannerella sp.]
MHIEFLVEDLSGEKALKLLLPKILGTQDTYKIRHYKGIGHLPHNLKPKTGASKRILLDQLPKLLQGFGKTFAGYGYDYPAAVVVICDLDDKDKDSFLQELKEMLAKCTPQPETRFCLAIEEFEAWYLGDKEALLRAYPKLKQAVLAKYEQDAICGTWETLADAVYDGGHAALSKKGYQAVGMEKSNWAERISPYMDVSRNLSPSFNSFLTTLSKLLSA